MKDIGLESAEISRFISTWDQVDILGAIINY